jgi:hypothetical protein
MTSLAIGFKIFKSVVEYSKRFQSSAELTTQSISNYQWLERSASISVSTNSNLNRIYAGTTAGFARRQKTKYIGPVNLQNTGKSFWWNKKI